MKRNRYLNRLKNYFSLSFYIPINSKELLLNNQFLVHLASGLLPLKSALSSIPAAELQVHFLTKCFFIQIHSRFKGQAKAPDRCFLPPFRCFPSAAPVASLRWPAFLPFASRAPPALLATFLASPSSPWLSPPILFLLGHKGRQAQLHCHFRRIRGPSSPIHKFSPAPAHRRTLRH